MSPGFRLQTGMLTGCSVRSDLRQELYTSENTCHCCSWKMKGAMTWGDEPAGKRRGTLPSSPQIYAHVPSCARCICWQNFQKIAGSHYSLFAWQPSLGWDLGGKIVSHLEMPRGFPGMHLYLAWNGSRLFSLSPKLFMPETTDSFSISWNFWGPGKHTTFPTPNYWRIWAGSLGVCISQGEKKERENPSLHRILNSCLSSCLLMVNRSFGGTIQIWETLRFPGSWCHSPPRKSGQREAGIQSMADASEMGLRERSTR